MTSSLFHSLFPTRGLSSFSCWSPGLLGPASGRRKLGWLPSENVILQTTFEVYCNAAVNGTSDTAGSKSKMHLLALMSNQARRSPPQTTSTQTTSTARRKLVLGTPALRLYSLKQRPSTPSNPLLLLLWRCCFSVNARTQSAHIGDDWRLCTYSIWILAVDWAFHSNRNLGIWQQNAIKLYKTITYLVRTRSR